MDLRLSNIPAVPYNPGKADKVTRAHIASPLLEAGVFWVLESNKNRGKPRTWVDQFFSQLEYFPAGEHDEMVDCFTQATIYLRDAGQLEVVAAPHEDPEEIDYHEKRRTATNPYG